MINKFYNNKNQFKIQLKKQIFKLKIKISELSHFYKAILLKKKDEK